MASSRLPKYRKLFAEGAAFAKTKEGKELRRRADERLNQGGVNIDTPLKVPADAPATVSPAEESARA